MKEYMHNVKSLGLRIDRWAKGKTKNLVTIRNTAKTFFNRLIMLNENINVINFFTDH